MAITAGFSTLICIDHKKFILSYLKLYNSYAIYHLYNPWMRRAYSKRSDHSSFLETIRTARINENSAWYYVDKTKSFWTPYSLFCSGLHRLPIQITFTEHLLVGGHTWWGLFILALHTYHSWWCLGNRMMCQWLNLGQPHTRKAPYPLSLWPQNILNATDGIQYLDDFYKNYEWKMVQNQCSWHILNLLLLYSSLLLCLL